MSQYNIKKVSKFNIGKNPNVISNMAGGPGFAYTPELELITRCASNFMDNDSLYATNNQINSIIKKLVLQIGAQNPEFIMKLASWLRNEMNIRSTSIYLFVVMAGHPQYKNKPKPWLIEYGPYIMIRADEISEVLAAFHNIYPNEKVPQALYKAIANRLNNLSDYEAIKYRKENNQWSLKDVIKITHPKPKNSKIEFLFNWIINKNSTPKDAMNAGLPQLASYLKIKEIDDVNNISEVNGITWEFLVSKFGNKPEVWELAAKVMPPMAYVRNIRNLLYKTNGINLDYEKIIKAGEGKKVLPFRFLSAIKSINNIDLKFLDQANNAKKALEEAIELSMDNVPNLGKVAILLDCSGSMNDSLSNKTNINYSDVAKIFTTAAFKKADNAIIIEYNSKASICDNIEKNDRFFSIINQLKSPQGETSLSAALELANLFTQDINMLYILTDEQSWIPGRRGYAPRIIGEMLSKNPSLKIVNHNLNKYGTSDLPKDNRILDICGWSDQIFNVIDFWNKGDLVGLIDQWKPKIREDD